MAADGFAPRQAGVAVARVFLTAFVLASTSASPVDAVRLGTPTVGQAKTNWCWASSTEMILATAEIRSAPSAPPELDQWEVVAKTYPADCASLANGTFTSGCNRPGFPSFELLGARALSPQEFERPPWRALECSWANGSPVFLSHERSDTAGKWTSSGHAVVAAGSLVAPKGPADAVRLLAIIDPLPIGKGATRFESFDGWLPGPDYRPWRTFLAVRGSDSKAFCAETYPADVGEDGVFETPSAIFEWVAQLLESELAGDIASHLGWSEPPGSKLDCTLPAILRKRLEPAAFCAAAVTPAVATSFAGLLASARPLIRERSRSICRSGPHQAVSIEYEQVPGGYRLISFGDVRSALELIGLLQELAAIPGAQLEELEDFDGEVSFLVRRQGAMLVDDSWLLRPFGLRGVTSQETDSEQLEAVRDLLCR